MSKIQPTMKIFFKLRNFFFKKCHYTAFIFTIDHRGCEKKFPIKSQDE